jgi:hypothetical protein
MATHDVHHQAQFQGPNTREDWISRSPKRLLKLLQVTLFAQTHVLLDARKKIAQATNPYSQSI